jgi:hypothetical protein
MGPSDKKVYSKTSPIAKIESLASILSVSPQELIDISNSIDTLWKPGKKLLKKSGEPRPTVDAKPRLKRLHEKIKNRLLKQVYFPPYLLGGIADTMTRRDYKQHATIHAGKNILISEDIKDFFPNSSYEVVYGIWKFVFRCTPEVAKLLTDITTLNGSLPQGWKTSGYLANLAFWDLEPELVAKLTKRGFVYSRFMDDITASCKYSINNKQKTFIVDSIYGMLFKKGYGPKRSKHQIVSRNNRMEVTGLTVNSRRPTLPNKHAIRAAVHKCERMAKHTRSSYEYKKLWNSVSGKVGTLTRFHPLNGKQLRERLRAVKPI